MSRKERKEEKKVILRLSEQRENENPFWLEKIRKMYKKWRKSFAHALEKAAAAAKKRLKKHGKF